MDSSATNNVSVVTGVYQQQSLTAKPFNKELPQIANISNSLTDTVQVNTFVTKKNLDTVRTIEQMHAHLNQIAKEVRATNESINKATEQVDAMKGSLEYVLKNFPPFPIDSEERKNRLMEYTSLRKELISLMVPPPPPAPYEKIKHQWDSLFDEYGKIRPLNVSQLEISSNDSELKDAVQGLDRMSLQLADLSNEVTQTLVQI